MRTKQCIVDFLLDELASAYADSYYFDEEKFEKLSQRSIDYICNYLINELNILGYNYDRDPGHHFYTFEAASLIYDVVGRWKSDIVERTTYSKENGFKGVDRFMKDQRLDDDLFYGGGWDRVVMTYEDNMGKNCVCGFFL